MKNLDKLIVRGAREHNLKSVSIEIPRDALVVFTGLSGSGKSSLAFDTIYAEGQRRYVESLSSYARQFLGQMDKPDVDFIEGLSPAISIDQKSGSRNPRSTVGTVTEIYDYLRVLYARIGIPHCPKCGAPVGRQTPQDIVDSIMRLEDGTRFEVLAPVVRGRKGEYSSLISDLGRLGYQRFRIDGQARDMQELVGQDADQLARYENHSISVVVDRLIKKSSLSRRLTESLETALGLANGVAEIHLIGTTKSTSGESSNEGSTEDILTFSQNLACVKCSISFSELEPRSFSFNSPFGACESCSGLGVSYEVDPALVIRDPELSIADGVIDQWRFGRNDYYSKLIQAVIAQYQIPITTSWKKLKKAHRDILLYGTGDKSVKVSYRNRYGRAKIYNSAFEGIMGYLSKRHSESGSDFIRGYMETFMREVPCRECEGSRLKAESRVVTVGGLGIYELCAMPISQARTVIDNLGLDERQSFISERLLKEIGSRLGFLDDVGLGYLSLARSASTLAGGEAQRIRLASQIGSGLVGVLYVLDEPSIGLHQRDNRKLIDTLERLRDLGNSVIVVEHDEDTIRAADYLVDIGPGAGEHGGQVVFSGKLGGLIKCKESLTGQYLGGKRRIEVPSQRRACSRGFLTVTGAREHNLKDIDVEFPLGCFTCVTGVSGSGKSTLVNDILLNELLVQVNGANRFAGAHDKIVGVDRIDKVVAIDQSPIGRTPRSNPATYVGVFDHIRKLFSQTNEARARGYAPGRFSFNVGIGRCQACEGDGTLKIEMHFLPDVYVPCESCHGTRYNRDTLEVEFKGKNIAEVLSLSIEDAHEFFRNQSQIARHLSTLLDVGLGYVRLGQPAPTLSGGEAQRVKLASELSKRSTGKTLYILDEPTTGLHFEDVSKLLTVLHRLVDSGNSVIVIEHNLEVVKTADWIIDLGPGGGSGGGELVAHGTPEEVSRDANSFTGAYLRSLLGNLD